MNPALIAAVQRRRAGASIQVKNVSNIYDSFSAGTSDGVTLLGTYQLRARIFGASLGLSIQFVFGNFNQLPDLSGANSIGLTAGVDDGSGLRSLTFSSSSSVTIPPGGAVLSDPINVTTSDYISIRCCPQVSSGQTWPIGYIYANGFGGGYSAGVDLTTPGSDPVTTGVTGYGYGPLAIIAPSTLESIILRGDSIMEGNYDPATGYTQEAYYDTGWPMRILNHSYPFGRWAKPGSFVTDEIGLNSQYSDTELKYHTYGICEAGVNDLSADTALQIQANMVTLWTQMKAAGVKRIAQSTITPYKDTSKNPIRVAVNTWLRTIPAPLDYFIEAARAAESSPDAATWADGYSDDGTHPNLTGTMAIVAAVGPALLADIGGLSNTYLRPSFGTYLRPAGGYYNRP